MRRACRWIGILALCALGPAGKVSAALQPDTYREAYDAGYASGVDAGKHDHAASRPYDFANQGDYQSAVKGFDAERHDRDVYSVAFRRGFEDGYEVGYGLAPDLPARERPPAKPAAAVREAYDPSSGRYTVPAGTEIRIRLNHTLSTQHNDRGDRFEAETIDGLRVGDAEVIPAHSIVRGVVTQVKRPGRIRGRAEMNLRFNEIELPSGEVVSIRATVSSIEERADEEVKDDEGTLESPGTKEDDVKKVGAATGVGALIGVLAGGTRGGGIGAAAGAVAGLAGVLVSRGQHIILPSETEMSIRLDQDALFHSGLLRK